MNTNTNLTKQKFTLQPTTILLIFSQIADGITTIIFLNNGIAEANPLPHIWGWNNFILYKIGATLLLAFFMEYLLPTNIKFFTIIKWILAIGFFYPALYNIFG